MAAAPPRPAPAEYSSTSQVRLRAVGWAKDLPGAAHSLTGAFLGLLVTFRTNNSYGRYWEARTVWGGIMNTCRSLAIGAAPG